MKTDRTTEKDRIDLIMKVLTYQATSDECVMLDQWIRRSDDNKRYFLRFRNSWIALSQAVKEEKVKTDMALELVNRKIALSTRSDADYQLTGKVRKPFTVYLKTAALWLLIFGLGAISALITRAPGLLNLKSSISVVAPLGAKAMTILPDGTTVWLNAGSRIEYRIPAERPARKIDLEGEAYFMVAKDTDNPFIVNAGEMIVKAFGTEFDVKAYPDEKMVETTLVNGSVSVEIKNRPSNRTMLKPNEQAVYYRPSAERSENFLVTKDIDPALYTLWINDRLQIKGVRLGDLVRVLERKYDVTIRFDDERLKDLRFTGIIENETIEQIMELLKISSDVTYRIEGREIWLSASRK
jgi:transmembrane sensor